MEFTAAAAWLNTVFAGFDNGILEFMHTLETSAGAVLTPLSKFITLIGEKGLLMFALAFVFMLFSRTRKLGLCMFGAVCCGALITNIILKDLIARPRPFEAMAPFMKYWKAVGAPAEDGFSFPSGHVTAAAAGMSALMFVKGRKFILPTAVYVFLMCFSRNYLMAHYPSDVLAASLVGLFSGFVAYLIGSFIIGYMEDNDDLPFFGSVLNFNLPLPDMSGLIKKLNRVPGSSGKGAKKPAARSKTALSSKKAKRTQKPGPELESPASGETDSLRLEAEINEDEQPEEEKSLPRSARHSAPAKPAMPAVLGKAMSAVKSKAAGINLPSVRKPDTAPVGTPEESPAPAAQKQDRLDFDFDSSEKKTERGNSDWNARWEAYRRRRDEAQVKTSPAAPGSAQMEFENIFAGSVPAPKAPAETIASAVALPSDDEDVKIFTGKAEAASPAAETPAAEVRADKAEGTAREPIEAPKMNSSHENDEARPSAAIVDEKQPPSAPEAPLSSSAAPAGPKNDSSSRLTDTGSIKLDLDEIYSLLNGTEDFDSQDSASRRPSQDRGRASRNASSAYRGRHER